MVIDTSFFEQQMAFLKLPPNTSMAVAVSGGADSLCLTFLLNEYAQKNNHILTALTVNHNIRPESTDEAAFVHQILTQNNIHHNTLTNEKKISPKRLEEQARKIRYRLLCDYCLEHQIKYLFLAHHQSDQIETFLARLARGSGTDGLSAIKPLTHRNGVYIVRPLLNVSKEDIVDTLQKKQIKWVEDPMNQDCQFERVKWRQFLSVLIQNGLKPKMISLSIKRLNQAREALDFYTQTFIQNHTKTHSLGYMLLENEAFSHLPFEIKARVLAKAIAQIGQSSKQVSLESVEQLILKLPTRATLGECVIISHKQGIFIGKEPSKQETEKLILPHQPTKWDRFLIQSDIPIFVRADAPKSRLSNVPFLIQKSFPAVYCQKELEKKTEIDYKEWKAYNIYIQFTPQIEEY